MSQYTESLNSIQLEPDENNGAIYRSSKNVFHLSFDQMYNKDVIYAHVDGYHKPVGSFAFYTMGSTIRPDDDDGHVAIRVKGDYQRQGLATAMVKFAMEVANAKEFTRSSNETPNGEDFFPTLTEARKAYHGTAHDFQKFEVSKIGTGEGADAYGWGIYLTGSLDVADFYRRSQNKNMKPAGWYQLNPGEGPERLAKLFNPKGAEFLSGLLNKAGGDLSKIDVASLGLSSVDANALQAYIDQGHKFEFAPGGTGFIYEVEIPDDSEYLDWNLTLPEQSPGVLAKLQPMIQSLPPGRVDDSTEGIEIAQLAISISIRGHQGSLSSVEMKKRGSLYLLSLGIPGIRYQEGLVRTMGKGERNYIIFDSSLIKVVKKNTDFKEGIIDPKNGASVRNVANYERPNALTFRFKIPKYPFIAYGIEVGMDYNYKQLEVVMYLDEDHTNIKKFKQFLQWDDKDYDEWLNGHDSGIVGIIPYPDPSIGITAFSTLTKVIQRIGKQFPQWTITFSGSRDSRGRVPFYDRLAAYWAKLIKSPRWDSDDLGNRKEYFIYRESLVQDDGDNSLPGDQDEPLTETSRIYKLGLF